MKILALIKQVPDPNAIRFDASGGFSPNTPRVINEYDQFALEEAIRIKEASEDVEIVVASVGPAASKDAVTRGLAMGADRGILIKTDGQNIGSMTTAKILAEVAKSDSFDVILVGQETSDSGTGNVGPQLAALLDIPFVSNVIGFELEDGGTAAIKREVEDGWTTMRAPLPVIACALTGLNEPRYPSLKGIMAARRKPVDEQSLTDYGIEPGSMTWGDLREEERTIEGTIIEAEPEEAAKQLVALLRERDLI